MRRNILKLAICLTACFLSPTPNVLAQNLSDEMVLKAAAPLIENKVVDGVSIGYIHGDKYGTVHLGSSGAADAEQETANNSTLYEIGSISKVFTSLLLADAVVRGEIELEATASVKNRANIQFPSHEGRSINWIDLSTHRSGLPRLPSNLEVTTPSNPYENYDSRKAAEALTDFELPRSPGESQAYSNLAVSVLGYLVAENTGTSYQEILQERIAKPLRMSDCTTSPSANQKNRHSTPHSLVGSPTPAWTFADLPGAGGVRATMKDMMRFAQAQLYPPKNKLGEAIELAWKQHTSADDSGPAMGLGWMIMDDDGQTHWHNGQTGGSRSMLLVNRKKKLALIVLSNTAVGQLDPFAIQLMQEATGELSDDAITVEGAPQVSPFTSVGFFEDKVIVEYKNATYLWKEIDDIPVAKIVVASKEQYGKLWQKRIREDLVEVLWTMDHKPGESVKLRLQDFETKKETVIAKASMTKANRSLLQKKQLQVDKATAGTDDAQEKLEIDAKHRARLVGRYKLAANLIFDVKDRDGHLMVGMTNQPTTEVFPDSATHWSPETFEATLEFKLRNEGPAKSLVLHQNGIKQTAKRMKDKAVVEAETATGHIEINGELRERLVGRYKLKPDFIFDVQDRDGHLMVGITNQPTTEVFPDSATHWSYKGIEATLEFKLRNKGPAKSLVLHQNGAEQAAKRMKK